MTTQATANARSRRLLWLLAALATGLNGCSGEPFEQASDSVAGVSTPAPPTEDLVRSALTRAFREQASNAARITRADVTGRNWPIEWNMTAACCWPEPTHTSVAKGKARENSRPQTAARAPAFTGRHNSATSDFSLPLLPM